MTAKKIISLLIFILAISLSVVSGCGSKEKAEPQKTESKSVTTGNTLQADPVSDAVAQRNIAFIEAKIKSGTRLMKSANKSYVPQAFSLYAFSQNYPESAEQYLIITKLLIDSGNVGQTDLSFMDGLTPGRYNLEKYRPILDQMMQKGANPNAINEFGENAVSKAVAVRDYQYLSWLIEKGGDVPGYKDKAGNNLIMTMFLFDKRSPDFQLDKPIVDLLLRKGVNLRDKNNSGQTFLELYNATSDRHKQLIADGVNKENLQKSWNALTSLRDYLKSKM